MAIQVVLTGDLLVVVEGDLGAPADADSAEEAAAYGAWIIRHQPFPGDNQETGYAVMRQMLEEAGLPWARPHEDAPAIEAMLRALEAGTISEAEFVDWVRLRVATA
jgi:prophage maintenance system killer protein